MPCIVGSVPTRQVAREKAKPREPTESTPSVGIASVRSVTTKDLDLALQSPCTGYQRYAHHAGYAGAYGVGENVMSTHSVIRQSSPSGQDRASLNDS